MTTTTGSRQFAITPLDGGAVTKESLFEDEESPHERAGLS
jgi:hypothetical protein